MGFDIENRLINLLERWQFNVDSWLDDLYERKRARQTPIVPSGRYFYLRPDGDDDADGQSYGTAWRTIALSEKKLRPGDIILLSPSSISITGSEEEGKYVIPFDRFLRASPTGEQLGVVAFSERNSH